MLLVFSKRIGRHSVRTQPRGRAAGTRGSFKMDLLRQGAKQRLNQLFREPTQEAL